eukprot:scaffold184173_cov16-Tisochrysis_lutea.AAC.1
MAAVDPGFVCCAVCLEDAPGTTYLLFPVMLDRLHKTTGFPAPVLRLEASFNFKRANSNRVPVSGHHHESTTTLLHN